MIAWWYDTEIQKRTRVQFSGSPPSFNPQSPYFSNLNSLGKLSNLKSVTNEVKMMMDPNSDSFAQNSSNTDIDKFGASDVFDLNDATFFRV